MEPHKLMRTAIVVVVELVEVVVVVVLTVVVVVVAAPLFTIAWGPAPEEIPDPYP